MSELLDIHLKADLPNGEEELVGQYRSTIVPHIGEQVLLNLHAGTGNRDGSPLQYSRDARFMVVNVTHIVFNHMQTEEWQIPWSLGKPSDFVEVEVVPQDEDARAYLARLAVPNKK